MFTRTGTVTVNAAFLQEIKEDGRELQELLDRACETFSTERLVETPRRRLVELLSRLCDQIAMHFALEEAYGYFDDAIDIAPGLSTQADSLRVEHERLFLDLCDIVEQAEQLLYHERSRGVLGKLGQRFGTFYQDLMDHEARENDLIVLSFDDDLGMQD